MRQRQLHGTGARRLGSGDSGRSAVRGGDRVDRAGDRVVRDPRGRAPRVRRPPRTRSRTIPRSTSASWSSGVPGRERRRRRRCGADRGRGRAGPSPRLRLRGEGVPRQGRGVDLRGQAQRAGGGHADERPLHDPRVGPLPEGREEVQRSRRDRAVQHEQWRQGLRRVWSMLAPMLQERGDAWVGVTERTSAGQR